MNIVLEEACSHIVFNRY